MNTEQRRRAYLNAMQVVSWLPRVVLPFAAPSRAELLQPLAEPEAKTMRQPEPVAAVAPALPDTVVVAPKAPVEISRPAAAALKTISRPEPAATPVEQDEPAPAPAKVVATPRFALQLLRAGSCAVLVELPTGESFQSRDPAYLLLKDLLRAAGLPDSPQQVGDGSPIRWPLLSRGNLDQGPDAARDYVQGVLAGQLESQPCTCLWLIGLPAIRFAGEADEQAYNRELNIEELSAAWALPGLELLMDEPARKAELWHAMRRVMQRWKPQA